MAISEGNRFSTAFDDAVPRGVVLIGDAAPDTEYHRRADPGDRSAGRDRRPVGALGGLEGARYRRVRYSSRAGCG